MRARLFTYEHIQAGLTLLVWVCAGLCCRPRSFRTPWLRRSGAGGCRGAGSSASLFNWRWWPAVVRRRSRPALPGHFFAAEPHGTVHHQVWAVILKLVGSYLLAVVSWVLLLAWAAVLLARQPEPAEDALDSDLLDRLYKGRLWIAAWQAARCFPPFVEYSMARLPEKLQSGWIVLPVGIIWLPCL